MQDDPLYFQEDELTEELTEGEKNILTRLAEWVVKRKLTAVAIMFLEPMKPVSFVGSQGLLFLEPFIRILPGTAFTTRLRSGLGKREGIEFLLREIERIENQRQDKQPKDKPAREEK